MIEGFAADGTISAQEYSILSDWLREHHEFQDVHPFSEIAPALKAALVDGVLTEDERHDLVWLCERLRASDFYGLATGDLQRLHALVGAVAVDGIITKDELNGLSEWLESHAHLRTLWPYDEIDSLVTSVLSDGVIDKNEHAQLLAFLTEFVAIYGNRVITQPLAIAEGTVKGICAVQPQIVFANSLFCFTGTSAKHPREDLCRVVKDNGGKVANSVTQKLNYLVIGGSGNPCWAYACYGRKVEAAVNLRKKGVPVVIVHEYDFLDAVADLGSAS